MSLPQIAILNGRVMPVSEATLPVTDEGLLRGDSVFEVLRVYDGAPFALDEHLARMIRSAGSLRLEIDLTAITNDARVLLDEAPDADCCLRLVVTRGGTRIGLLEPAKDHSAPLTLQTVSYSPTRVLDQVKSVSYAGNMLATRLAQEQGAGEALLVTPHGRVLEGPTFSVFFRFGDEQAFVTPPLEDHVLDSITRRIVLGLDLGATERVIARDDLAAVAEAVAASTTREVQAIASIDGLPLPVVGGPATERAQAAFRTYVAQELAAR